MADLPEDITLDILLRLPVKCLLRFKSACKTWYNIISNPLFAREHMKRRSKLKIIFLKGVSQLYSSDYGTFEEEEALGHMGGWLHNSCDGWFIAGFDDLYLWNPSTRERKILPNSGANDNCDEYFCEYGFGYDSISEDYKVLRIQCPDYNYPNSLTCDALLFTLSKNSWQEFDTIPYRALFHFGRNMILVENALHFLAESHTSKLIISFDLGTEEFKEITLPNYREDSTFLVASSCWLCVVDVVSNPGSPTVINVWVMKEYGIEESWTRLFSINQEIVGVLDVTPFYLSENGEILLRFRGEQRRSEYLILYDSRTCKVKNYNKLEFKIIDTYVETLVSIGGVESLVEEKEKVVEITNQK